jgi:hypothetical protein
MALVGIVTGDQRHTENVCARDRDEAASVDLVDEVDLFSAVP